MAAKLLGLIARIMPVFIIAAFLVILYVFIDGFVKSEASVKAAIIAGLAAVSVATVTYWKDRSKSIKEAHRDKKIEIYSKFYDLMFTILESVQASSGASEEFLQTEECKKLLTDLRRGMMFYGSPDVIRIYNAWNSGADSEDGLYQIRMIGRLLLAMREDIGLSNAGLDEFSINQVIAKDDLKRLGPVK